MAGTEHFGATAQPRDHIPEFCRQYHLEITHFLGTDKYGGPEGSHIQIKNVAAN